MWGGGLAQSKNGLLSTCSPLCLTPGYPGYFRGRRWAHPKSTGSCRHQLLQLWRCCQGFRVSPSGGSWPWNLSHPLLLAASPWSLCLPPWGLPQPLVLPPQLLPTAQTAPSQLPPGPVWGEPPVTNPKRTGCRGRVGEGRDRCVGRGWWGVKSCTRGDGCGVPGGIMGVMGMGEDTLGCMWRVLRNAMILWRW